MRKLMYGVAYNSRGKFKTRENGNQTKINITWHNMIKRCYDPKTNLKNKTYLDCSVVDEWLDFQVFAEWYVNHEHNHDKYCLDKDILYPNNKIYSPKTCCFVPHELNNILLGHRSDSGEYPYGVSYAKDKGKFHAYLNINGKRNNLGHFNCPLEAYQVYKTAKERHVKNMALKWANKIQWEVFVALMNWELPDART